MTEPSVPSKDSTMSECNAGTGGVTLMQMAENIKLGRDPYAETALAWQLRKVFLATPQGDYADMAALALAAADEIERLRAEGRRLITAYVSVLETSLRANPCTRRGVRFG